MWELRHLATLRASQDKNHKSFDENFTVLVPAGALTWEGLVAALVVYAGGVFIHGAARLAAGAAVLQAGVCTCSRSRGLSQ